METISKEILEHYAAGYEDTPTRRMAREILESRADAEPVAWLNDAYLARGVVDGEAGSEDAGPGYIPVYREPPYTKPQPAPAFPQASAIEALATNLMKRIDKITGERHSIATLSSLRVSIVDACLAAMLQTKSEPVDEIAEQAGADPRWVDAYQQGYNDSEARKPAIPDGWKLVPVVAFPSQWAAGQKAFESAGINKVDDIYKAMVAAAPQQEAESE